MINVGEKIKQLRLEKGLLQKDIALILNVARNTITQYENNTMKPSYETLVNIARYFKVTTDYLLGLETEYGTKIESYEIENEGTMIYTNGRTKIKHTKK